jgi:hypothetical protein
MPDALPTGGWNGTPASRASTTSVPERLGSIAGGGSTLSEEFMEEIRFVEQFEVFAQFIHIQGSAMHF